MKKFALALALLACFASEAISAPAKTDDETSELEKYRLPDTHKPKTYTIELSLKNKQDTSELNKTFDGIVDIEFHENLSGDVEGMLKIHRSKEMEIKEIIYCADIALVQEKYRVYHEDTEIMEINLPPCNEDAKKNKLHIEYSSVLYDDMYGFYVSTIETHANPPVKYTFATTQFQGTYARRAFPCLDEPKFKASFDITIKHPEDYKAMSNQKAKATPTCNQGDTLCSTKFAVTPTMSTYLVAFIVYPIKAITCDDVEDITGSSTGINDLEMQIFSPKHLEASRKFSVDETRPIIDHLNKITKINYHESCPTTGTADTNMCDGNTRMEQLNQIAIPDFAAGAMENWGLVTYRETALLYDDKQSTWRDMQRIATVIAHEFAHMWFGNLVTVEWWSSTWLNEGFARYFEYHVINDLKPAWKMADQFVVEQMHSIFQQDVTGALALTSDVYTQSGVKAKFGSITYNKGACIIRMLERALHGEMCQTGKEGDADCNYFLNSLNAYLKANKFKNSTPEKLFTAFTQTIQNSNSVLKDKITEFMKSWTEQIGYPVVTVSFSEDKKKLTLKQEPFEYTTTTTKDIKEWYIPITYYIEGTIPSTKPTHLMKGTFEIELPSEGDEEFNKFVIFNVGQTGYYRVKYEGELWNKVKEALDKDDFSKISEINRAQIVDDTFNLARIGKIEYVNAFDMINFLQKDTSYFSWYAAFNGFSYLRRRLPEGNLKNAVTKKLSKLMEKVYGEQKEFKDGETGKTNQIDMYKKILVLQWACEIGNEECRNNALEMFNKNEGKKPEPEKGKAGDAENKTPANLRKIVYCEAARKNENIDTLWEEYKATTSAANRVTIITALGCSNDKEKLKDYLQMSIESDSGIRKQDAYSVFTAVLTGSPEGVDICLDFLIANYAAIREHYASMNALSTVITSVADRLTTPHQATIFFEFLENNKDKLDDAKDIIPVAKETVKANEKWLEDYKQGLEDSLNDNADGYATSIFSFSLSTMLFIALSVNLFF